MTQPIGRIGKGARGRPSRPSSGGGPSNPSDLTFADFTYLGCAGFPTSGIITDYSNNKFGGMTGRNVGGQTRIFLEGNGSQGAYLVEFTPPASLQPTFAQAVAAGPSGRCSIHTDWGNIYQGFPAGFLNGNTGNPPDVRPSILYYNGNIYFDFFYSYNTSSFNDRCVGAVTLNPSYTTNNGSPTTASHGTWRFLPHAKSMGGYFGLAPSDFAGTYLSGHRVTCGAPGISGVNTSPYGVSCYAIPDMIGVPASSAIDDTDIAATGTKCVAYSKQHRMLLPNTSEFQRRICDWADPGNHATLTSGIVSGATTIPVSDTSIFCGPESVLPDIGGGVPGWHGNIGDTLTAANNQEFYYGGRSTTSGPGNLTGVPASGTGSIHSTYATGINVCLHKYDTLRGGIYAGTSNGFCDAYWGPIAIGEDVGTPTENVGRYFDYVASMAWIQSSSGKQGLLVIGVLPTTLSGFNYGGSDPTYNHIRYGGVSDCPHGQDSTIFESTGPVATTVTAYGWIHSFTGLASIIQGGGVTEDTLGYTDFTKLSDISAVEARTSALGIGPRGSYFDETTNVLWLLEASRDRTSVPGAQLPIIHAWHIA
jgi:hypothetical protein